MGILLRRSSHKYLSTVYNYTHEPLCITYIIPKYELYYINDCWKIGMHFFFWGTGTRGN